MNTPPPQVSEIDVKDIVIERDTGARSPYGMAGILLTAVALSWTLFQLWIASPLQFSLGIFILNDTESRAIHLAFAIFLAFTAYPAFAKSPRHHIPIVDWILAFVSAFCASYIFIFSDELAMRPGLPTQMDVAVAVTGMVVLLEAARRSIGLPMVILAICFLVYTFFGDASWMPDVIAHKGMSLNRVAGHQWLSTEGVFGIALGVSSGFVFLFVLFGSLLDKAGAGNYFIKLAFSLLGHYRGGPAKAAVMSSGLTGLISGSSIANVVTTGTFTIPLMKRVGFRSEKAGAVEVASSVNGQIMPPVMGAAAFIMVENVGISYQEVIRHAFLPAVISYIGLLYMVHLEALKGDMQALQKPIVRKLYHSLLIFGVTVVSIVLLTCAVYYGVGWIKTLAPDYAFYIVAAALVGIYIALIYYAARYPDLEPDDPDAPVVELPQTGPTVKTGLHYLLPVVALVWCLMVEQLSPGLSAFWACILMIFILATQRPLFAFFRRKGGYKTYWKQGVLELREGMVAGARNMIGIGIATAAAGIIVGTISLTGIGQIMISVVETLSGGSLILMLMFTALISLILGMGLPTTANYVVVASIMPAVVIELGRQHGLIVPLIAVHLFVFYFGIMADITPPVGLASFAAAAISRADPIRTGWQAFIYSTRTAILPFCFIFNTKLLLIEVSGFMEAAYNFMLAMLAVLIFSSGMQGYFYLRSRWYESIILLVVSTVFFVPSYWLDFVYERFDEIEPAKIEDVFATSEPGTRLRMYVAGEDMMGDPLHYYVRLVVPEGETGKARMESTGLYVVMEKGQAIVDDLGFNSHAEKAGFDYGNVIESIYVPAERPPREWAIVPAVGMLMVIFFLQYMRRHHARITKKSDNWSSYHV